MKGPAIALAIAAVLAPSWLNGVALVSIRVPVVLVAVLIAGTSWRGLSVRHGALLALAFAVVISGRGILFDRAAAVYEKEISDLAEVTVELPEGARVLPLRAAGFQQDRRFYHVQGLLVPMRDVFVPTLFQGVHALTVREAWADHAKHDFFSIDLRWLIEDIPETIPNYPVFVRDWDRKFTHAILLDHADHEALDHQPFVPLKKSGRFTLYKIDPDRRKVALKGR